MIAIRESIDQTQLDTLVKKHIDFVGKEVKKRIDFYIGLFEILEYLQAHKNTRVTTIESRINTLKLQEKQYEPFIGYITSEPSTFKMTKLNSLKEKTFINASLRNFVQIVDLLKKLRKHAAHILSLDLSQGGRRKLFYEIAKPLFAPLGKLNEKIFDYEWFSKRSPHTAWGPYQLTAGLEQKVCPYCNRLYTFTLSKGAHKVTKPELDHFLPQNENRLLALSFYNLIPSCTVCNRDCKGKLSFNYQDYLSPYDQNPNHGFMTFDYIPTSYAGSIGESEEIMIFIKTPGISLPAETLKKINGNINTFQYKIIVNEHRDVVREIVRKRVLSNDSYLKMVTELFPGAGLTLDEAYRLAYGNFYSEKEFSKRPLAKLTKDIAIGVGVIKPFKD